MTTKEAISDVKFNGFLEKQIQLWNEKPLAPAGEKFRRTPFDGLKDSNLLNTESVLLEYVAIREKVSRLPRIQREAIVYLVNMAMSDVVSYRKKESERKARRKNGKA